MAAMSRTRRMGAAIAGMLAVGAAGGCTITEDTVRQVLTKEGYEVLEIGPPTIDMYKHSFKAKKDGELCEGNITVSGIAWFPDFMLAARCGDSVSGQ